MLAHIPVWVFGVFALLLVLGIWLSRPRTVSPIAPVVMAIAFPVYSLYNVLASFGVTAGAALPWAAALLLSVLLGRRVFGPRELARAPGTAKVHVPGSWLPLGLIMGIFLARFAIGFVRGAQLPVGHQAWFAPVVCFALGALSGGFVSRAVTILRFIRRATHDAQA